MALYNDIAASRMAAEKLWGPTLNLDHMGNDWSLIDTAQYFWFPETTQSATPAVEDTWTTMVTFEVTFPDDYALDDTFDELEVALSVIFQSKYEVNSGGGTPSLRLVGTGGTSTTVTVPESGYTSKTLVLTWLEASEPTGSLNINLQCLFADSDIADPDIVYIRRITGSGAEQLNCFIAIRQV